MSSHDDKEAQDAKIARLETLLSIQQERYDSRIKELEQKNTDLELDKRLSATKLQDQATRPAVSTESSFLTLQTEVLQLRQDNAAKDEELFNLRTLLRNCQASLTATKQGFIATIKSLYETTKDLRTVVQGIDNVLEAGIDFKELQSRPSSTVADTAAGPSQPSSLASRTEKTTADTAAGSPHPSSSASKSKKTTADTAVGPPQPSPTASTSAKARANTAAAPPPTSTAASKSEKITVDTAAAPQPSQSASKPEKVATSTSSASTTSSTPDYAKALKSPEQKTPRLPRGKVPLEQSPLFARPPVTHADLAVTREAADQTRSEPERQQISQKPNRAFNRGRSRPGNDARGRGDTRGQGSPGPKKGETSHESTSQRQSPLTNFQHPGSESTQVTMSGTLEGKVVSQSTNTTAGSNQLPNNPKVKSSVATSATQTRRKSLADEDKKASSNRSPVPTARRRRKAKLTDEELASFQLFGFEIPSETDSDDDQEADSEAVAPPVPATPRSPQLRTTKDVPQSQHSITNSDSGIGLNDAATADIKPAQSRQIQPQYLYRG